MPSTFRRVALALAVFALGWCWILQGQHRLWARLPSDTVVRYAADVMTTPLPEPMPLAALRPLCAAPPSLWARALARVERAELAACLADSTQPVTADAIAHATAVFSQYGLAQIQATERWLAAHAREAGPQRAALAASLRDIQAAPSDQALREPVGPRPADDALAASLQSLAAATAQHLQDLRDLPAQPSREQALALGLQTSGRLLLLDYGTSPPSAHFASDRRSLADALTWRRHAQQHAAEGFSLARLHGLPEMLLLSSALLLLAVAASGGPLLPWVIATQLLGASALLLTDLALTGDPALRYLVDRQFFSLGGVPLSVALPWRGVPRLWLPLLALAALLLALGRIRRGDGGLLAPVRAWVNSGTRPRRSALQAGLLTGLGVAAVLGLGLPAAVSEGLIALGCIGLATYLARQAAFANAGGGLDASNLIVALGALAVAVGGALARGDLGHALVALALGAGFFALFGGRAVRGLLGSALVGLLALLSLLLFTDPWPAPLTDLRHALPPHAQERLLAMADPFHVSSSDLARTQWLMHSAGLTGWGAGYVPWQGLAPGAQAGIGLPLQGPSDYVLALSVALWGQLGGLALMGLALALFAGSAALAARTALRPGMPLATRWLSALGLFGCAVMAVKILLSLGGVAGVLPLTGLPVALLGYGPVGHGAALLYLALALGTAQARSEVASNGASLPTRAGGLLWRRGLGLAAVVGVSVLALLLGALWLLRTAKLPDQHLASARFELVGAVAQALGPGPAEPVTTCPELARVAADWNTRLAARQQHLDLPLLQARAPGNCRELARALGQLLQADSPRLPVAERRDFSTANAWWGLPGCAQFVSEKSGCGDVTPAFSDLWLQRELAPRLQTALLHPSGSRQLNGRSVATGPDIGLSLDAKLQANAQQIADCFTGRRVGTDCAATLPRDPAWRERYAAEGHPRAAALGIVVADVDSGRLLAFASAISDCSQDALARDVPPAANGQRPVFSADERRACAQWPDRRSAYLALQSPALWMVPPGSALKPLALLAAIDSGQVPARDDIRWKRILAESHDQASVQRAALNAGQAYLQALARVGFDEPRSELLWGDAGKGEVRWHFGLRSGTSALRVATAMPYALMNQIRQEQAAGVNIDQRHGHAQIVEYLAARHLADTSIGSADLRISALGLVDVWRRLDLRARGQDDAAALHLLELPGQAAARISLNFGSPAAARRALAATSGISASAWGGTAQGACRVVMGTCPAEGLPGLVGKTGTSDFLTQEDAPWVKPHLQLPAKLFGGVFSGPDGRRYAIAVMALRVREGQSLELKSSAAAEAALTLIRQQMN